MTRPYSRSSWRHLGSDRGRDRARARRVRKRRVALVRRRARRLSVRDAVRDLRGHLPVRGVAAPPTDGQAAPTRLAGAPPTGPPRRQRTHDPGPRRRQPPRADVHRSSLAGTLARPPARVLGLRARRARHVPAGVRLVALRVGRAERPRVPGVRGELGHRELRLAQHRRLDHLPPARHRGGPRPRGGVHVPRPASARSRRAGGRAQQRLPRAGRALRGVGDRADAHRIEPLDGGSLLHVPDHGARADRDPRTHVHPVREAVPHLPAPREPRSRVLRARRRGRPTAALPGMWARRSRRSSRWATSRRSSRSSASTTPSPTAGTGRTSARRCRRRLFTLAQSERVGGFG